MDVDFDLSESEKAFRDEIRAWLNANAPRDAGGSDMNAFIENRRAWQKKLYDAGYVGMTWPKEYGGSGRSFMDQLIFNDEMILAHAPEPINVIGLGMGGPVVIAHGNDEQKKRYLEPLLSAEEIWCQGFSEPNAGSDLSGLQTRAEDQGDHYVVNGQKVWTTLAHVAKWCMLLARERKEANPRDGLTYLLVDMKSPGIEVRPLVQLNGYRAVTSVKRGGIPGPEGSILKLMWSELNQRMTETAMDIAGPAAQVGDGDGWKYQFLRSRANTIEAGTSEVLRNILAERVLGLPRSR